MPKSNQGERPNQTNQEMPEFFKVFSDHGVDIQWKSRQSDIYVDCPFCDGPKKLGIKVENGQWRCNKCDVERGNAYTFMEKIHECSTRLTKDDEYAWLRNHRKLLSDTSLKRWGVVKGMLNDRWIVPGYNAKGRLNQLYLYKPIKKRTGEYKYVLLPTSGLTNDEGKSRHGMLGMHLFDDSKPNVCIVEGVWDAICLWELLHRARMTPDGLVYEKDTKLCLINSTNVIAIPGAAVLHNSWLDVFSGKRVRIIMDSDHPKLNEKTGNMVPPAGFNATKRIAKQLLENTNKPESVECLIWGEEGYDETLDSGYDLRDWVTNESPKIQQRIARLDKLLAKVEPVPSQWQNEWQQASTPAIEGQPSTFTGELCYSYEEVIAAWEKALMWSDGLQCALTCMLATAVAVPFKEDQLWLMAISVPSTGKTTLADGIIANPSRAIDPDIMSGMHSGFKKTDDPKEDHSILALARNKLIVTKDGDPLMSAPNRKQILSELRVIYDGNSKAFYRNAFKKAYIGYKVGHLLCGTPALQQGLDDNDLGARYLTVCIIEQIEDRHEQDVMKSAWRNKTRDLRTISNCQPESREGKDKYEAKQKTAGYLEYLCQNAEELMAGIEEPSDQVMDKVINLSRYIAHLRARPSKREDAKADREFSVRLMGQLAKLTMFLCLVMQKTKPDAEIMKYVTKVAMDTAKGSSLELVKFLYTKGDVGAESVVCAKVNNRPVLKEEQYLRFLKDIGIVERFQKNEWMPERWRLTKKMRLMYEESLANFDDDQIDQLEEEFQFDD